MSKLLDTLGRRNRKHPDRKCCKCGAMFRPKHALSKYCSRDCLWHGRTPKPRQMECWWKNAKGYTEGRILVEGKPKRVKLHRHIVELALGRELRADEDVHHVNGDKGDNRLCNLEVISHGEHSSISGLTRVHRNGYRLNLTPQQREAWRNRARIGALARRSNAAIAKAEGK